MLVVVRLFHLTEKVLHPFLKSGQWSQHGRCHDLEQHSVFPWAEYTGQTFDYIGDICFEMIDFPLWRREEV